MAVKGMSVLFFHVKGRFKGHRGVTSWIARNGDINGTTFNLSILRSIKIALCFHKKNWKAKNCKTQNVNSVHFSPNSDK